MKCQFRGQAGRRSVEWVGSLREIGSLRSLKGSVGPTLGGDLHLFLHGGAEVGSDVGACHDNALDRAEFGGSPERGQSRVDRVLDDGLGIGREAEIRSDQSDALDPCADEADLLSSDVLLPLATVCGLSSHLSAPRRERRS